MNAHRSSNPLRAMLAACACVLGLAAVSTATADTYDAVREFSLASNPNGVWTYGTLSSFTGGTLSRFTVAEANVEFAGEQIWDNGGSSPNRAAVVRNTTDTDMTTGTPVSRSAQLRIDGQSLIVDVRWTAPAAGTYNVTGLFERADTSAQPVSVRVVENGMTVLFSADNFTTNGTQQPFNLVNLTLQAGATLDFAEGAAQYNNDGTGLAVTISTTTPNFAVIHLINDTQQGAVSVLNGGAAFVTDFEGTNDVTITELAGSLQPVFIDNYGGASPGNNPSYLTTFFGATENGTGAGVTGELRLLDTNQAPPNVSLQFDFAQPLNTDNRILIADVDTTEEYQIKAYHRVGNAYQALGLTGWTHEQFSGQTGIQPDGTWPTWDPTNGTLTSNANSGNINEPLDVFTPDVPVDRLVFTKLTGDSGDAGIQVLQVSQVPVITSAATASANVGNAFSYQIVATNSPTSYGFQGNANGLSINPSTGVISGTPKTKGTFIYTLNAFNAHGKGSATLTLTVGAQTAPVITSATTASGNVGSTFSYQIVATSSPTSFGFQGNANGLTIDPKTGVISGTPAATGTFSYTLNAYNAIGKGSATLTLTVKAAVPKITSPATASGKVGSAFFYQIAATNNPTSYGFQGNANGLSINPGTGAISGVPKAAGTYTYTLNAYNSFGKGSATLTVTIAAH